MPQVAQQDYILVKPKYTTPADRDWGVLTQLKKAVLSGYIYDVILYWVVGSSDSSSKVISQSGAGLQFYYGTTLQVIAIGNWSIEYGEAMTEISAQIYAQRGVLREKVEIFAHELGDRIIAKDNILGKTIACNNHPLYFVLNDSDIVESVQIGADEIEDALNISEEYIDGFINYVLDWE